MYKFDGVGSTEHFKRPMDSLRPRSKSDGLVKRTLDFARVYSDADLHKTEENLEAEIRRESCIPPRNRKVARLRLKGERLLHSKLVLLVVVILNLIDCTLVLGELILDIHFIREFRSNSDDVSQEFIDKMQARYPQHLHGYTIDHMDLLFDQLYLANCQWYEDDTVGQLTSTSHVHINKTQRYGRRAMTVSKVNIHSSEDEIGYTMEEMTTSKSDTIPNGSHMEHLTNNTEHQKNPTEHSANDRKDLHGDTDHHHEHSVLENVAHGMHKASIAILGILFVENLAKLACMGRAFLIKKLEVFDAVVVFISFVVDLILLKGLMNLKVQDAVFILTFLLPWRVIRVVNSMIVAILDHEHFRLKMLYQEKKVVTAELKTLKAKEKGWDFHLKKIEHFCESEGIPKWKIRQHTAMGRKQSTITTMASLALNGFLKGMVTSPSDKVLFERTLAASSQDHQGLDVITESDRGVDDDETDDSLPNATESDIFTVTSDEIENSNSNSRLAVIENGLAENMEHCSDESHAQVQPDHGIIKNESRGTLKSVTFVPKEKKPLINRQESFDDDGSFTGWK